jgi:hypothetical protein
MQLSARRPAGDLSAFQLVSFAVRLLPGGALRDGFPGKVWRALQGNESRCLADRLMSRLAKPGGVLKC